MMLALLFFLMVVLPTAVGLTIIVRGVPWLLTRYAEDTEDEMAA